MNTAGPNSIKMYLLFSEINVSTQISLKWEMNCKKEEKKKPRMLDPGKREG